MDIRNFFGKGKDASKSQPATTSSSRKDETKKKLASPDALLEREEQTTKKRKEVSADEFFASTAKKPRDDNNETNNSIVSPKKRVIDKTTPPTKSNRMILDEDSDEYEVPKRKRSTPDRAVKTRGKITIDDAQENNSDTDEDKCTPKMDGKKQVSNKVKSSSFAKKATPVKKEPIVLFLPETPVDSYADATPGCLEGYTFVFSGVLTNMTREESEDYVKCLGGRVTGNVSSKTQYLVCGDLLEDGRPYTDGSKYKKAKSLNQDTIKILHGERWLYAVTKLIDGEYRKTHNLPPLQQENSCTVGLATNSVTSKNTAIGAHEEKPSSAESVSVNVASVIRKPAIVNPYAKKTIVNPYAKKTLPSAATKDQTVATTTIQKNTTSTTKNHLAAKYDLWADKYAPRVSDEILGNGESVRKLKQWLSTWEKTFNNPKAREKACNSPNGPWKAALLSGPPGIGKTTTATLVAKESGRSVIEFNASDARSKKALHENLGDITGSQVLNFSGSDTKNKQSSTFQKRCVIMDEVDGMGAGDRSGISELIKMIKESLVPIICICNDRQSPKIRSLVSYCLDLKYRRPTKNMIAKRAVEIGQEEGMMVELNAAEAVAESCGNDIRQVLNMLQMWSCKKSDNREKTGGSVNMTYKEVKDRQHQVNKDDVLRLSIFDATKIIIEGPRGVVKGDSKSAYESLSKRCEAFFMDYGIMGLNVHQNYLKVMLNQFLETKRSHNQSAEIELLDRMHDATAAMSDFAVVENSVRGGEQNWGLLPFCSILAVKTGFHAAGNNGGFLPGFPEFSSWLGRNSSRGRMGRLLQELHHHMNYKVSGDSCELRLHYLPVLRSHLYNLLTDKDGPRSEEAIAFMDEYGLDRDDVFENLDEFTLDSKAKKFSELDSKVKAAFTREYNKGVHKSQALVAEQGVVKTRRKEAVTEADVAEDLEVVNDDGNAEPDDDDNNDDTDKIKSMFQRKGRASKKETNQSKTSKSQKNGGKRK